MFKNTVQLLAKQANIQKLQKNIPAFQFSRFLQLNNETPLQYKSYELKNQQIMLYPELTDICFEKQTQILEDMIENPPVVLYNDPFSSLDFYDDFKGEQIYQMRNKTHEVAKKKRRKRKFGAKTKPRYK